MKNLISILIITFACMVGSFLGVTIYEIVNTSLLAGKWSFEVLTSSHYTVKLVSILTATLFGAIGQEIIIPAQHKYTFWRYIQTKGMVGFTLLAGIALGVGGALAIAISFFMTQGLSIADFFVNDYDYRCLSILPAAFIFGACYGLGRWKSYKQMFGLYY